MSAVDLARHGSLSASKIGRWLLDAQLASEHGGLLFPTQVAIEAAAALDTLG